MIKENYTKPLISNDKFNSLSSNPSNEIKNKKIRQMNIEENHIIEFKDESKKFYNLVLTT